jgi:tape measure domain-containing protein
MSTAGDIKVGLILEGAAAFKADATRAANALESIAQRMDSMGAAASRAKNQQRQLISGFREYALNMELARVTVLNLTAAITSLPSAILSQGSFFDKTAMMLAGLERNTDSYAESVEVARKQLDALTNKAASSPYTLDAMVDSMTKLKAANVDNASGFLNNLVNTAAKFGKSSEELKRATIAIQQMAGKGILSMEELRQQFGEAVPDAMGLMARAAGMSVGELVKKISSGTVEAKQALRLLNREMMLSSMGSAAEMAKTWEGATNRISTAFQKLAREAANANFYDTSVGIADQFATYLGSDKAMAAANKLGFVLSDLAKVTASSAEAVYDNLNLIVIGIAAAFAPSVLNKIGSNLSAAKTKIDSEIASWPESTKVVQNQMLDLHRNFNQREAELHRQWVISRTAERDAELIAQQDAHRVQFANDRHALEQRLRTLQSGQSRLRSITNSVVGMFGGWTTVIVAAIGVALYALDEFYLKQKRITQEMIESRGLTATYDSLDISRKERSSVAEDAKENDKLIETLERQKANMRASARGTDEQAITLARQAKTGYDRQNVGVKSALQTYGETLLGLEEAYNKKAELQKKIRAIDDANEVGTEKVAQYAESTGGQVFEAKFSAKLRSYSTEFNKSMDKIESDANEAKKKAEKAKGNYEQAYQTAFREPAEALRNNTVKQITAELESARAAIDKQLELVSKSGTSVKDKSGKQSLIFSNIDQERAFGELAGQKKKAEEMLADLKSGASISSKELEFLSRSSKAAKQVKSDGEQMLITESGKLASLKAGIDSQKVELGIMDEKLAKGKELAKLEAKIAAGYLSGDKNAKAREQARVIAVSIDMAKQEQATIQEQARQRRTTLDRLDDMSISISKKMGNAGAKTDNPFMEWRQAAEQTNEAIKEIEKSLREASTLTESDKSKIKEVEMKQHLADQYNISAEMQKSINKTHADMLPPMEKARYELKQQQQYLDEILQTEQTRLDHIERFGDGAEGEGERIKENIELIKKQKTLTAEQGRQNTTIYGMWQKSIDDMADSVDTKLEGAFEGVFDAFADGIVEGKDSFNDMIVSMTKDLEKFFLKMAMMQMFESTFGGMFGGMFGGTSAVSQSNGQAFTGSSSMAVAHANGGVMTSEGPLPLRKYAKGGIATSPQLALFGEGAHNEAYVPLPDGRTIPVTMSGGQASAPQVNVNIINSSGTPMEAEQSGTPRFDGERYIVDVVISAMSRPGQLRTAIKGVK